MDHLMIHTRFIEFLHEIHSFKDQNHYQNDTELLLAEHKMYSIASYIHQHYGEDLSLEIVAEKFHFNRCYLSHRFKEVMQFTFTDYVQRTRVKNAQHKLLTTDEKIVDIASSCGFASFSQFNRVFRQISGVSPREYRKSSFSPIKPEP